MHHLETRERDQRNDFLPPSSCNQENKKRQSCRHFAGKKKKKKKSAGNHGDDENDFQRALWLLSEEIAACLPTLACTALYKHNCMLFAALLMIMPPLSHRHPLNVLGKEARRAMGSRKGENSDLLRSAVFKAGRGLTRGNLCSFAFVPPTCPRVLNFRSFLPAGA